MLYNPPLVVSTKSIVEYNYSYNKSAIAQNDTYIQNICVHLNHTIIVNSLLSMLVLDAYFLKNPCNSYLPSLHESMKPCARFL